MLNKALVLLIVFLIVVSLFVVEGQRQPKDLPSESVLEKPKELKYSKEELNKTIPPIELIKSTNSSYRAYGYKRLAQIALKDGISSEDIDKVFLAIEKEDDPTNFPYALWPLGNSKKLDEMAMNKLFQLLESDRPEIWYGASTVLNNRSDGWINQEAYEVKRKSIKDTFLFRLNMTGSYSPNYANQLQAMGDKAYPFLVSCLSIETHNRCPEIYGRASKMLGYLGGKEAVPVLAASLSEMHKHKKTLEGYLGPLIAIRAINKLVGSNYGDAGQDLDSILSEDVKKINWDKVIAKLNKDFPN